MAPELTATTLTGKTDPSSTMETAARQLGFRVTRLDASTVLVNARGLKLAYTRWMGSGAPRTAARLCQNRYELTGYLDRRSIPVNEWHLVTKKDRDEISKTLDGRSCVVHVTHHRFGKHWPVPGGDERRFRRAWQAAFSHHSAVKATTRVAIELVDADRELEALIVDGRVLATIQSTPPAAPGTGRQDPRRPGAAVTVIELERKSQKLAREVLAPIPGLRYAAVHLLQSGEAGWFRQPSTVVRQVSLTPTQRFFSHIPEDAAATAARAILESDIRSARA